MSLLLDALKRAEQSKRRADGAAPADNTSSAADVPKLSLEEMVVALEQTAHDLDVPEPTANFGQTLPHASLSLADPIDLAPPAPAAVRADTAPPARTLALATEDKAPTDEAERATARNLFAAKQETRERSRGKWILPLVALLVVGIGAGVWYVWREVNGLARGSTILPKAPMAARAPASGTTPTTTGLPGAPPSETANTSAEVDAKIAPMLPPPAVEVTPPPTPNAGKRVAPRSSGTEAERVARAIRDNNKPTRTPAVALTPTPAASKPGVSPELTSAWAALARGDYTEAKARYSQLVSSDPFNLDTQLGLAASAARLGDPALAAQHYRRALELDPRNTNAQAGLMAVGGNTRAEGQETELRNLIARNPESSALHFSLGNAYARENRWNEAQQAYFEAWRLDTDNVEYLHNLAVSLDHLGQARLATEYYQKALAQAAKIGTRIDRDRIERRIAELAR